MPDRCHIPSSCDCGFADARSKEAIPASNYDAFLDILGHVETCLQICHRIPGDDHVFSAEHMSKW